MSALKWESVSLYQEREAALKAQIDDLQRQLDNARTDWLCDTCNGRGCEAENQNAVLLAELENLKRHNSALEKLIIKAGYIITNFNGEMALCRDPWHQPKEEQP